MRLALLIAALAITGTAQAQVEWPHPRSFTQRQIDMMPDSYLRGLRRAYPDYIIRRSNNYMDYIAKKYHYTQKQLDAMEMESPEDDLKYLKEEEHVERPIWYKDLTLADKKRYDAGDYANMEYGKYPKKPAKLVKKKTESNYDNLSIDDQDKWDSQDIEQQDEVIEDN